MKPVDVATAVSLVKSVRGIAALALIAATLVTNGASYAVDAKDNAALRRKCAHDIKVRLGIKDTGSVQDLAGVKGAIEMVDQCVANGGKS